MTELSAGVWLGLVGQNGHTFLHRAVPLCDSDVTEQELLQIYQVRRRYYTVICCCCQWLLTWC